MSDNLTWKDFVYICCRWCDFKTKGKDEFTRHSLEEHFDSVIEECDSIENFVGRGLQGKILPKTKMQIRKEWQWAMSDDIKIDQSNICETMPDNESTSLRNDESKVDIIFIL